MDDKQKQDIDEITIDNFFIATTAIKEMSEDCD
jgi:hypothetical protein